MSKKEIHKNKHTTVKVKPTPVTKVEKLRRPYLTLLPVIPNLLVIAACLGLYYVMVNYYLFFQWGIFIYYAIKLIIAYQILAASKKSIIVPLGALFIGLTPLIYAGNIYINTAMTTHTAWQLTIVGLIGLLISILVRINIRKQYA
jgi:hypothetical protein